MTNLNTKNLKDVRPGDYIVIGIEGINLKYDTTITKIVKHDRVMDFMGNIWNRDGRIFRRGNWHFNIYKDMCHRRCRKMSARPKTQKEFDKKYKQYKVDHLKKYDWSQHSIEELENFIDKINVGQGNRLGKSRF